MPKKNLLSKRNVESIRQENVKDNQMFLKNLLMTNIRNDFLNSARSVLRKHGHNQIKKKPKPESQKKEHSTRYNEKVKSGEIGPFVPEWQRHLEEKRKEAEKRLLEKEERKFEIELRKVEQEILKEERIKLIREMRRAKPSPWIAYYRDDPNGNPYQRVFKPRLTKVGQQAEQYFS